MDGSIQTGSKCVFHQRHSTVDNFIILCFFLKTENKVVMQVHLFQFTDVGFSKNRDDIVMDGITGC